MKKIGLLTGLALTALPTVAYGAQFTLADNAVMHTEAGGATVSIGAAAAPANLVAPDDYSTGMLHHRVMVTNLPATANETRYQVCFVQAAIQACSNTDIAFSAAGTFEASQTMASLTNAGTIDWTMPLDDVVVIATDAAGVAVDASETTWAGYPDYTLYYPLDLTYQAVVVSAGDSFAGFPGDPMGMPADAPAFGPPAGSYELSVDVSIGSPMADATIYYTVDGSDPDMASTLYDAPFTLSQTTTVKAIAYVDGFDPSPVAEATYTIVDMLSNGLRGRYYNGRNFGELTHTRTDPQIEFSWDDGQNPTPDTEPAFSVIWTGQVTPLYSGAFTFTTVNDDGVRLWVNNQLVIDDWNSHGPEEHSGNVSLSANEAVPIWLEYYNGGGPGSVSLSWESSQQPAEIVPNAAFDPNLPAGTTASVSLLGGDSEAFEFQTEPIGFEIRRRGDIDGSLSVPIMVSGTATAGTDFTGPAGSVMFAPGELSRYIEFTLLDDDEVEDDETIEVSIGEGGSYTLASPTSAIITIVSEDVDLFDIRGTVSYTGTESGSLVVEAFTDTDEVWQKRQVTLASPGSYEFLDLEPGSYNVIAYVDSNENERLDAGETWGAHTDASNNQALVTIGPDAEGININLDVPPGSDPDGGGDEDGCCATIDGKRRVPGAWILLVVGLLLARLRRPSEQK